LAVKIVRQPNKIAIIGAPSSAAAFFPGSEKAPAALRSAGLIERLQSIGYEVIDHGDCAPRLVDEERRDQLLVNEEIIGLVEKPRINSSKICTLSIGSMSFVRLYFNLLLV